MSKKEKVKDLDLSDDFFKTLAKEIGGDILSEASNCRGFIDTGILAVNYICSGLFFGGGIPMGSLAEVSGESASGKSLFGANVLKGCQNVHGIPICLDAENAFSKDFFVKVAHINPDNFVLTTSDTLQKCFNKIHKMIRVTRQTVKRPIENPIAIIYDSIAVSPSEREFAATTIDIEEATDAAIKEAGAGVQKPGERAQICSLELRKLMPVVKDNNALILFINQLRNKIGVMYGDPRTEAGGGEALKYYCSTRLRMFSNKQIKDKNGRVIGMNVTFKNTKSRFTSPFQEAKNVHLFFEKGINPFGGLLELMMTIGRVSSVSPGNYKVNKEWTANGEEVKFKSSKENNTIPTNIILDNPKLIDAENIDQIAYYLNMFGESLQIVASGNFTEEEVSE